MIHKINEKPRAGDFAQRANAVDHLLDLTGANRGETWARSREATCCRINVYRVTDGRPSKRPTERVPLEYALKSIRDNLGRGEGHGCTASLTNHPLGEWFMVATEWDLKGEDCAEALQDPQRWVNAHKDGRLERHLRRQGIELHWAHSGNRSVYCYTFFKRGVDETAAGALFEVLGRLLPHYKPDRLAERNGIRLPMSVHSETKNYCLLLGTKTVRTTARWIMKIQPSQLDSDQVIAACSALNPVTHPFEPTQNAVKNARLDNIEAPNISEPRKQRAPRPTASPFTHPLHNLFEQYLTSGIPKGQFQKSVFSRGTNLWAYTLIRERSQVAARAALIRIHALGVDSQTAHERKAHIDRLQVPPGWTESFSEVKSAAAEANQAVPFDVEIVRELLICQMRAMGLNQKGINALEQTASHCLTLIARYPDGAGISIESLMRELSLSKKTAIKHLRFLRDELPILRIKPYADGTVYSKQAHKSRIFELNTSYVAQLVEEGDRFSLRSLLPMELENAA